MQDRLPQLTNGRFVAMPQGIQNELPSGIALDLLVIEIRHQLKESATPFSKHPRHFDLPLDEALAVVALTDDGFSDQAAWWLAREASVTECLDQLGPELS